MMTIFSHPSSNSNTSISSKWLWENSHHNWFVFFSISKIGVHNLWSSIGVPVTFLNFSYIFPKTTGTSEKTYLYCSPEVCKLPPYYYWIASMIYINESLCLFIEYIDEAIYKVYSNHIYSKSKKSFLIIRVAYEMR